MAVDNSGANSTLVQHLLGEIIAGGVTIHLVSAAQSYTDGAAELSADSEVSVTVAEADFTVDAAGGFATVATLTTNADIVFDVSGVTTSTTIVELAIQNQTNTDQFVLSDETNDPDIGALDTYTLEAGEVLYELGNPA